MNSLILCEGKTDCILLQYYLEKVYSWVRVERSGFHVTNNSWSNLFKKNNDSLIIAESKGCNRLPDGLALAMTRNENAAPGNINDFLDRIIIFSDNDEEITEAEMLQKLQIKIKAAKVSVSKPLEKGNWNQCDIQTIEGKKSFMLYVMFVPFEENGALETYLLNCVGEKDEYDKSIIVRGNSFIETVDPEKKYLNHRRTKTKAKFDVYFSVRTAVDQYSERQDILKSVEWEKYENMRKDFSVFSDLG